MNKSFIYTFAALYLLCGNSKVYAQKELLYAGEVIVKLKAEARDLGNSKGILQPQFQALIQKFQAKEQGKMFPNHTAPREVQRADGNKMADLSLMYKIALPNESSYRDFCVALSQLKFIEYAEPKFQYPLLYNPSDTLADSVSGLQWQLRAVRAYEAWNIHRGDTNYFAGILDSGMDFTHVDLKDNVKYNEQDTLDGIDNDGNGYVDDFIGWNLSENNNNTSWNWNPHGVKVAGAAFASTDNVSLMAGNAFHCKFMPVKVYGPTGGPFTGFESIVYAADRGAHVINLSWGTELVGPLQYEQEIIRYAAINKDVVVVAAAGNTAQDLDFYPASYDFVTSVGQTNFQDHLAAFATYSTKIDISAPGIGLPLLSNNGSFQYDQGSSFAAPQVAAAALLLRSYRPHLSALQAAEQVRITADLIDTLPFNQAYAGKLGRGRLNMYKMLNDTTLPSIRLEYHTWQNTSGKTSDLQPGDTVVLQTVWKNYLKTASNIEVRVGTQSPYFSSWLTDSTTINTLAEGDTLTLVFTAVLSSSIPENSFALLRFDLTGSGYQDFDHLRTYLRPSYLTLDAGRLSFTSTSRGKNGFNDFLNTQGIGIRFMDKNLMYESGLMLGKSPMQVSDVVRFDFFNRSNDFSTTQFIERTTPTFADEEVRVSYTDSVLASLPMSVEVTQQCFRWDSLDNAILVEFTVKNTGTAPLDSLYLGQFNDWDIVNYYDNSSHWDSTLNLGYVLHNTIAGTVAGVLVLGNYTPHFTSIDNYNLYTGGINITNNFSKAEKYQSLSQGIFGSGLGANVITDISQVVSVALPTISAGNQVKASFAYLADTSLAALQLTAYRIKALYQQINTGPIPNVQDIMVCAQDSSFSISANNTQNLNVYADSSLTQLLFQGNSYSSPAPAQPFSLWVTNSDSLFESPAKQVIIQPRGPFAGILANKTLLTEGADTTAMLYDISQGRASTLWQMPSGAQFTGDSLEVRFSDFDIYNSAPPSALQFTYAVKMETMDSLGCIDQDSMSITLAKVLGLGDLKNGSSTLRVYPNPAKHTVWIQEKGIAHASVMMKDLLGKTLELQMTLQGEDLISIEPKFGIEPGLYLLHLSLIERTYVVKVKFE